MQKQTPFVESSHPHKFAYVKILGVSERVLSAKHGGVPKPQSAVFRLVSGHILVQLKSINSKIHF